MPTASPLAFEEALHLYDALLRRVCRLYCSDLTDRQDLYQEIVMQLWQGWSDFQGLAQRSTWLYRVALNVAISQRRRARPPAQSLTEPTVRARAEASPTSEPDDLSDLYHAIARLSDVEKALVLLRLEGRPDQEVADILGITPNNVRVKMHRALTRLRQFLTPSRP